MMLRYPRSSPTRRKLDSELSELIGYNLYGLEDGFVDTNNEEPCAALRLDERIADAVALVRRWGLEGCWREGEDWIVEALAAIVGGTEKMDHLHRISQTDNSCYLCTILEVGNN